jgi:hypothetical protein
MSWNRLLLHPFRLEPKLAPSDALERVARFTTLSRRTRSWAGLSKDPVPRRGFPHPLRSAFAVSHDLDGLLLSEPSDVFQPVTLVEFLNPEEQYLVEVTRPPPTRRSVLVETPPGPPVVTRPRSTEVGLSPACSWQARKRDSRCPLGTPQRARPLDAVCCRIRLDRSCNPGGWAVRSATDRGPPRCTPSRPATVAT